MSELYLQHYGVKGMKWGVRKDRSALRSARSDARTARKDFARAMINPKVKISKKLAAGDNLRTKQNVVLGEKAKLKRRNKGVEKYTSKRVGEFQREYGDKAVARLAKNTRKGKVSSVKQQEKRELTRSFVAAGGSIAALAITQTPGGRKLAAKGMAGAAKLGRKAYNAAANAYWKANPIQGASQAVRNLQPIAALPSAYRVKR
ncbi:MAG: hypothetical protein [Chaetfec virus UA24_144]|nr:MAG: hypothetical protein [Chaetfec virus UA24_144]